MKKIKLSDSQIEQLVKLPETGMGYHKVDIKLYTGQKLYNLKVLNSEILLLEDNNLLDANMISQIMLSNQGNKE